MTAPNHIAGGLFFAGFWTSLWNINIFQKPQYIAVAVISSIIADIDSTRSLIGFTFYPLAKWLDRKYGHRTITHSILFLTLSTLVVHFFENNFLSKEWYGTTVIYFFALLSHLIIDMVTIQGVPLLYPFRRNACVIPGRAEYRIRTGDIKSEMLAFIIFCCLNFLCIDLYRQGFWLTYNKTFTTIEHVHYERANSPNFTLCKYFFIAQGKENRGIAPIIDSKESSLELFIAGEIIKLDYSTPGVVIKSVSPIKTSFPYRFIARNFYTNDEIEINSFCKNQIISGTIESTLPFILNSGINQKTTANAELKNSTHTFISIPPPDEKAQESILKQIAIKKQSLIQDRINFEKINSEYYRLITRELKLKLQVTTATEISVKNSLENELIKIRNKLQFMPTPVYTENTVTMETIRQLYLQLNHKDSVSRWFNAGLRSLDIPDSLLALSKQQ